MTEPPLEILQFFLHTDYMDQKFTVWMNSVDKEDIALVGGKGANLGEMAKAKFPVPPAFIVTSYAYFYFLKQNKLDFKIKDLLETLDWKNPQRLQQVSQAIRKLILTSKVPEETSKEIIKFYSQLQAYDKLNSTNLKDVSKFKSLKVSFSKLKSSFSQPLVAVRSSATAEDLPGASFAGQQETFLNIKGEAALIEKVRQCWASLWLERAIFYRHEKKFDHFKVGIAVPVQMMIQSEKSGVMFTVDPLTSNKTKIIIEAIYGLGELIVQGAVTPDHYEIEKSGLKILSKQIGPQEMIMSMKDGVTKVSKKKSLIQKITDEQILKIAQLGKELEKHYFFPQDVEWAMVDGKVYIVQTRPITTLKENSLPDQKFEIRNLKLETTRKPILTGIAASPGIGTGPVRIIKSAKELKKINAGDILVAEMTNPDFVPAMKKVVAVLTDRGGRTAHAAIVSRELGLPCVVGTATATKILKNGDVITVDGAKGEVYRGGTVASSLYLVDSMKKSDPKNIPTTNYQILNTNFKTATKIYVNLAEPERAEEVAKMNVDGVGLLRAEFMMAQIGVHPKKIIADKKQEKFINRLAENLAIFCKAFENRPVIYRATDFKTNEYRNLKGGEAYEPLEDNPLMGFRGTYRYVHNPEVFELELAAIKKVRNGLGYKNLYLMLPFVRTVNEFVEAKKIIAGAGLLRSPSFKLLMMVEVPANVILLEDFLKAGVDGVSIGSNDLSMLILGVDRDNAELSRNFNEKDPAVLWALEKIIKTCAKQKVTCSLCGQAASDYPEIVEKLVKWGITSVSVNIDVIERVRETVYEAEKKIIRRDSYV